VGKRLCLIRKGIPLRLPENGYSRIHLFVFNVLDLERGGVVELYWCLLFLNYII
jgi:hypothetical protein